MRDSDKVRIIRMKRGKPILPNKFEMREQEKRNERRKEHQRIKKRKQKEKEKKKKNYKKKVLEVKKTKELMDKVSLNLNKLLGD